MHFPRIIERHADEAAFLWGRRERAARSPVFDLPSLAAMDQRLDANLEGLVIAGPAGLEACLEGLRRAEARTTDTAGELFAAVHVAAELGDAMALAKLLIRAEQHPRWEKAVVSALAWLSPAAAARVLAELSAPDCPPTLQRWALAGRGARREDPGPALKAAVESEDAEMRSCAFRAMFQLGRRDLAPMARAEVRSLGDGADPWAVSCLVLFGDSSLIPALLKVAEGGGPMAERAAVLAACASGTSDIDARLQGLFQRGHRRAALSGAAARGDAVSVPWVLAAMESHPDVARRAAWVYSTITGARMEPPLAVRKPEENPTDETVHRLAQDAFEDLPAPQPVALREHWASVERGFPPGERRLAGQAITPAALYEILRTGAQPHRELCALELSLTSALTGLFAVRAPGFRQAPPKGG
ncbi:MAG: hypothetical protein R3B70_04365 [Polyangiaceae bacterium]